MNIHSAIRWYFEQGQAGKWGHPLNSHIHIRSACIVGEHPSSIYPHLNANGIFYALFKPLKYDRFQDAITQLFRNEKEKMVQKQAVNQ